MSATLNDLAARHVGDAPGDYRAACPICAKAGNDNAVSVTVEDDGHVVVHCHRCGENGAAHAERVNGARRPAARARPAQPAEDHAALWESGTEPGEACKHPYLVRKQVSAHGIRIAGELLLIPVRNAAGELVGVQKIDAAGQKLYAKGTRKTGAYHAIGKPDGRIYIAEGYATGATIHAATGHAVAVAFDCGNLVPVAKALREKYPDLRLVVCADDDYQTDGNPGITEATKAALAVGGVLAVPDFGANRPDGATDFNDAAKHLGRAAVMHAIVRAVVNAKPPDMPAGQPARENATAADSGGAEWPEPQTLTVAEDSRPYPLDALPGLIGEAISEVLDFVQCPPALAACSALSAVSLTGQALADVRRADRLHGPTSLYFLAAFDSGERKTTCDVLFMRATREWEREQAEQAKPDLAAFAAMLAAWEERCAGIKARIREAARREKDCGNAERELATLEAERPQGPRVPSLIHADATPEALAWELAHGWPSAGVMSSEAGIVFGGHGMGHESYMRNQSLLNALWDGIQHRVLRKTSESFTLTGARLTMGLAAQPETVRQFMEATKGLARGNGFLARFLIAAPQSTQGLRPFKEAPAWRCLPAFEARLRELLALPVTFDETGALAPPLLSMTDAARATWVQFHNDVEDELRPGGDMAEVRDVASKAADNVARMAALFHLYANGPTGQIDAAAITAAARIVGWHLYQARAFLGDVAAPRERSTARRLDAWLIDYCTRERVTEVERRTIQNRGPNPVRGRTALDAALAELAEAGRVREAEAGKRKLVRVNPALLGGGNGFA